MDVAASACVFDVVLHVEMAIKHDIQISDTLYRCYGAFSYIDGSQGVFRDNACVGETDHLSLLIIQFQMAGRHPSFDFFHT